MLREKVRLVNKLGLHARASSKFVSLANMYQSSVKVLYDGKEVNGKSLLGLLTLAAGVGSEIEIVVDGPDEEKALNALKELIANRFEEEE